MNAELVLFGKRVSMAQRSRRRVVVVIIYVALASLIIATFTMADWRVWSTDVIWVALFACRLFLGGYSSSGLVKHFNAKASTRSDAPPSLLALKLRIYQPLPGANGEFYRNDERELHQRDLAHYRAYRALGIGLIVPWITSTLLSDQNLSLMKPEMVNHLCSAMTLGLLAMYATLPQAILLWTEPDMEPDSDS